MDDGEGSCEKAAVIDAKTLKFGDDSVVSFTPAGLGVKDLEAYSTIGFEVATKTGDVYTSIAKVSFVGVLVSL